MTDRGTWDDATDAELRSLYRAVVLAPTVQVCEAILRGERVPRHRLDPEGLRRFGL